MKKRKHGVWRVLLLLVFLVVICVTVSYVTVQMMKTPEWKHDQPGGHPWLHEELELTSAQAEKIDAYEADYRKERAELQQAFNRKIEKLAEVLRTTDEYSDRVTEIVHEIHIVHGKIQQLAIEHYYDMLNVLPPEQQSRLREIAVEALSEPQ